MKKINRFIYIVTAIIILITSISSLILYSRKNSYVKKNIIDASYLVATCNLSLDTTCYICPSGKKYHTKYCKIALGNSVEITLKEALQQGYTCCGTCRANLFLPEIDTDY